MGTECDELSGRPKGAFTDENIEIIYKITVDVVHMYHSWIIKNRSIHEICSIDISIVIKPQGNSGWKEISGTGSHCEPKHKFKKVIDIRIL